MKATTESAAWLMREGSIALSEIETNGIRIDTSYLKKARKQAAKEIKRLREKLKEDSNFKIWRKRFGSKTNITSGKQLAAVLYEDLGITPTKTTKKGNYSTDAEALEGINLPLVKTFSELMLIEKVDGTFLKGIQNEVCNGFLHPMTSLHVTKTFRSNSEKPNFQNFPVRNKRMSRWVRRSFIARKGCVLCEVDYSGMEINASCFYHKDPALMANQTDPTKDMHRDLAAQCYMTSSKQVSKDMRYCAKNQFIFPQFYGDYYIQCTKSLWASIDKMALVTLKGRNIKEHLKKKGVTKRGACNPKEQPSSNTFEAHIKAIEQDFWNRRFRVYNQWKKDFWDEYQERGFFETLTGFKISGVFTRNEVSNWPVQGVAFQCLLLAIILLRKELKKRKMKTKIVGQIHDSIVADVPIPEVDEYTRLVKNIMEKQVADHWDFINVPLTVECEIAPQGGSWFDKKVYEIPA